MDSCINLQDYSQFSSNWWTCNQCNALACLVTPPPSPAWCVPQSMWTSHNNKIFVWSLQTIRSVQCRQENEVDTLLSLLNKQCLLRTQSCLLQRLACIHCTKLLRGVGWGWEGGETLWVRENTSALTVWLTEWLTSFLGNPVRILYSEGKKFFAPKKFIRS